MEELSLDGVFGPVNLSAKKKQFATMKDFVWHWLDNARSTHETRIDDLRDDMTKQ